jgi:hypothetical protein
MPEDPIDQIARELGLGATNRYPHGKNAPDDEGELRAGVTLQDEFIILAFGKPVSWVSMTAANAREIAALLLKKADALDVARRN